MGSEKSIFGIMSFNGGMGQDEGLGKGISIGGQWRFVRFCIMVVICIQGNPWILS